MKKPDCPTRQATVIDEDTVRIGGSTFKREQTCTLKPSDDGIHAKCSKCGRNVELLSAVDFGVDSANYCKHCGSRVERDACANPSTRRCG